ncbi:MAG: hypothetical protein M3Q27_12115 [Actinomycetota bacterium]|nr:hypothetical protein [Actinomycetota bacterium]
MLALTFVVLRLDAAPVGAYVLTGTLGLWYAGMGHAAMGRASAWAGPAYLLGATTVSEGGRPEGHHHLRLRGG